jgi:hypothetical protein
MTRAIRLLVTGILLVVLALAGAAAEDRGAEADAPGGSGGGSVSTGAGGSGSGGDSTGTGGSGSGSARTSASGGGEPWLYFGPRVGLTGAIVSAQEDFDAIIQAIFPRSESYFPLYTQLGLSLQERISLGPSGYRLLVKQWMLVGGLDQNFAYPLGALMLALGFPFGLEVGLGPALSMQHEAGSLKVAASLVYTAGWVFSLGKVEIPVLLLADPLPGDRKARLTVISGIDFGFRPKPPEKKEKRKKPPFNY